MENTKTKKIYWGYVLLGLTFLAIGLCFIIFSSKSLATLAVVIGIALIICAATIAVIALTDKKRAFAFWFKIVLAIMILVSGITVIICKEKAIDIMVSAFALVLIVDASFKFNTSAMCKKYSVNCWWATFATSIATIGLGFYLINFAPTGKSTLISVLLGITFVLNALGNFVSSFHVPLYEKQHRDEIYYELYRIEFQKEEQIDAIPEQDIEEDSDFE